MNRVYRPLAWDHPLVTGDNVCALCRLPFRAGERTTLLSCEPDRASTVQAAPTHARCALRGVTTGVGTISNIKDGAGVPYPVQTDSGHWWTFADVGIPE